MIWLFYDRALSAVAYDRTDPDRLVRRGLAMFALPAAEVLGISPVPLVFLAGFCMTCSAYFGIRGMEIVSYVSVPMILLLGGYSTIRAVHDGGGIAAVFARHTGGISVWTGIGLVIGTFVSGATATPNFTRFAASVKSAVTAAVIAFFFRQFSDVCLRGGGRCSHRKR